MDLGKTTNENQDQRLAKASLKFVHDHFNEFRKKANNSQINAFHSFWEMSMRKEPFSAGQCSYIDGLYEKTMAGLGFPSVRNQKSKHGVNLRA